LNFGRVIATGPPEQIAGDAKVIEAYLGGAHDEAGTPRAGTPEAGTPEATTPRAAGTHEGHTGAEESR
ncbi:MAG TPA: hypothetical protein VK095_12640, partial [Beutenbergiaceae bacterium]|nr:hypothetical protein [Beutenbergiaceae bacterium]